MLFQKFISFFSKKGKEEIATTKKGILKYFNRTKGFGFIKSKTGGKDVFVHVSEFEDFIKVGDEVRFEVERVPKGYEARKVSLADAQ